MHPRRLNSLDFSVDQLKHNHGRLDLPFSRSIPSVRFDLPAFTAAFPRTPPKDDSSRRRGKIPRNVGGAQRHSQGSINLLQGLWGEINRRRTERNADEGGREK